MLDVVIMLVLVVVWMLNVIVSVNAAYLFQLHDSDHGVSVGVNVLVVVAVEGLLVGSVVLCCRLVGCLREAVGSLLVMESELRVRTSIQGVIGAVCFAEGGGSDEVVIGVVRSEVLMRYGSEYI